MDRLNPSYDVHGTVSISVQSKIETNIKLAAYDAARIGSVSAAVCCKPSTQWNLMVSSLSSTTFTNVWRLTTRTHQESWLFGVRDVTNWSCFFPGIISGKGWLVNATICEQCPILRPGLSFHFIYAGYVPMLSMRSPSLGKSCQCYARSGKTNYMRWSIRRDTPRPVAVIPGFTFDSTSVYLVSVVQAINEINSDPSILEACAKFCVSIKQYEYRSPHIPRPGARDVLPNPRQGAERPDVMACENGICISN